ncbi:MAG TPA: hypothetical protein VFR35_07385 [Actinoplanes sp.]|nr:hypothetical protein [Actinoplanes sp.]
MPGTLPIWEEVLAAAERSARTAELDVLERHQQLVNDARRRATAFSEQEQRLWRQLEVDFEQAMAVAEQRITRAVMT